MVNHIVMWNFNEQMNEEERKEAGEKIRQLLEGVAEASEGVVSLEVRTCKLASSTKDIALFSKFDSLEALDAYQVHPKHVQAANYIKSVACNRVCFDYAE